MVRFTAQNRLGLVVATALLVGLVAMGMGQDLASALGSVKGKKCQIYLKSGEVHKGKLVKFGDDYITLEVKLSPFYAEPQTFPITQVDRIEYSKGVVDVERLLNSGKSSPAQASKQAPAVKPAEQSARSTTTSSSSSSSDDDTVQRLMAILKSLDEGPASKPDEHTLAAKTEPASSTEDAARTAQAAKRASESESREPAQQRARVEPVAREPVQPAGRPEKARKVVVPLTRRAVRATPAKSVQARPTPRQAGGSKSLEPAQKRQVAPVSRPKTRVTRRAVARKPRPKKTIPAPKPQRTRLANAAVSPAVAPAATERQGKGAEPPKPSKATETKLAVVPPAAGAAATPAQAVEANPAGEPVIRAVTVLAGAVGLLAVAVLVLAVVVMKRHRAAAPEPAPQRAAATPAPVSAEEPAPQPAPQPPAPIHVVMVKGDYAVVDHGLDHGIKVGELLLLRRTVEDGDYEIGLARVLKVFDRLSGVKLIERWVETDLRVGDSAVRYRPAEPAAEELASVAVTQVSGRPHPATDARTGSGELSAARLSAGGATQHQGGWQG